MALVLGKILEGKGKLLSEGDCSLLSSEYFLLLEPFVGFIVIEMQFKIFVNLASQMSPPCETHNGHKLCVKTESRNHTENKNQTAISTAYEDVKPLHKTVQSRNKRRTTRMISASPTSHCKGDLAVSPKAS